MEGVVSKSSEQGQVLSLGNACELKNYEDLVKPQEADIVNAFSHLVVIKLSGGLRTSMDRHGSKSLLPVKEDQTFLDLALQQLDALNTTYDLNIPLSAETGLPLADSLQMRHDNCHAWFPLGHGDVCRSFQESSLLDKFYNEGKTWLFISNIYNPGASPDPNEHQYHHHYYHHHILHLAVHPRARTRRGGPFAHLGNRHSDGWTVGRSVGRPGMGARSAALTSFATSAITAAATTTTTRGSDALCVYMFTPSPTLTFSRPVKRLPQPEVLLRKRSIASQVRVCVHIRSTSQSLSRSPDF
ncbi:UTP--glucose-1-phosphate uridylyltransferase [Taenia crassiceps]|uniref:UTP--glucose-1-phosphate uridylyltransferase n=1 Tax=Taenia crassiceps TaxID=6207 RepID=A0ABR4QHM3_9CEST